jgi:hypothetical protein
MEDIHEIFPSKKRNRDHRLEKDIDEYTLNSIITNINCLNINNNNDFLLKITNIIENNIKTNQLDKIYNKLNSIEKKLEKLNEIDNIYIKIKSLEKQLEKISIDKDYDILNLRDKLDNISFDIKESKYNLELKTNGINDYFS